MAPDTGGLGAAADASVESNGSADPKEAAAKEHAKYVAERHAEAVAGAQEKVVKAEEHLAGAKAAVAALKKE